MFGPISRCSFDIIGSKSVVCTAMQIYCTSTVLRNEVGGRFGIEKIRPIRGTSRSIFLFRVREVR